MPYKDSETTPIDADVRLILEEIAKSEQGLPADVVLYVEKLYIAFHDYRLPLVIPSIKNLVDRYPSNQDAARGLLRKHAMSLAPQLQAWNKHPENAISAAKEVAECLQRGGKDSIEVLEKTIIPALKKIRPVEEWPQRLAIVIEIFVTSWLSSFYQQDVFPVHNLLLGLASSRPANKYPSPLSFAPFTATVIRVYAQNNFMSQVGLVLQAMERDSRSQNQTLAYLSDYVVKVFTEIQPHVCFTQEPCAGVWTEMIRRYTSEHMLRVRSKMSVVDWERFLSQLAALWAFVPKANDRISLLGESNYKELQDNLDHMQSPLSVLPDEQLANTSAFAIAADPEPSKPLPSQNELKRGRQEEQETQAGPSTLPVLKKKRKKNGSGA